MHVSKLEREAMSARHVELGDDHIAGDIKCTTR